MRQQTTYAVQGFQVFFLKLGLADELEQNPYTSTHPYTQVFKSICHSNEIYSGEAE